MINPPATKTKYGKLQSKKVSKLNLGLYKIQLPYFLIKNYIFLLPFFLDQLNL